MYRTWIGLSSRYPRYSRAFPVTESCANDEAGGVVGPRRLMDCVCFVLSRSGWRDGQPATYLPMVRIGVGDGSQILTAVLYYYWLTCSTPTQSTPTQHAGNIGAQPKDGMRGRRLSEVCCGCFVGVHTDQHVAIWTVRIYMYRLKTCVPMGARHSTTIYTLPMISALFSIRPALSCILP